MKLGGANNGVYVSSSHKQQADAARRAGLKVDHYWFNGRAGTFTEQANKILSAGIGPDETVWWDVEDEEVTTGIVRARWTPSEVMGAAQALAAAGVPLDRQGVYLSSAVTKAANWSTVADNLRLWVADYGKNDGTPSSEPLVGFWDEVALWQYTSEALLPGYDKGLDMSKSGKAVWTVSRLQAALNKLLGTNLVVDGDAGPATTAAVRKYQEQNGLVADGVPGPVTLRHLATALAG